MVLSADDSHKNQELERTSEVVLLFQGTPHSDFLQLSGTASVSRDKAKIQELKADMRDDKGRLKQVSMDQHKELILVRDREKADAKLVRGSGAWTETIHQGLLEVHEKSHRDRLALRKRRNEDRDRLRRELKVKRAEISALRKKK